MITEAEKLECIACLARTVDDVMPQIGKIVLQDYEQLNRGLLLADRILFDSIPDYCRADGATFCGKCGRTYSAHEVKSFGVRDPLRLHKLCDATFVKL